MKNNFIAAFFLLFFTGTISAFAQESQVQTQAFDNSSNFKNVAMIRALNKSTAKNSVLELNINEKVKFGSLVLLAHKCWQAPLDQRPESKVLMEVFEEKTEGENKILSRIFYGWMFASSPSISSLEHPIYDVNVVGCK